MTQASASGKAILFGEHAVVYGQPAIAVPLSSLTTTVRIRKIVADPGSVRISAPDIHQSYWLHEVDRQDPLACAILLTMAELGATSDEPIEIKVTSALPIASGLGSGAAASVAIIRALAEHHGISLTDRTISQIAFETEKLHHGTPSGIDNSVITYEAPLYFKQGEPIAPFTLGLPLHLILGHCGVDSRTGVVVHEVRERWMMDPKTYDAIFSQIGSLVDLAQRALIAGQMDNIGSLMNQNHALLQQLGVSIAALDRMVDGARSAGAFGAKLSGAGAGGFMLALVDSKTSETVKQAIQKAGAQHVFSVKVGT